MALNPGTRLGPYEITAQIGTGGMGEVYKATDTRLGRTVAIKVLRDEFTGRFEREARAVAALNHPHICQLYDVGPNYLVMEFVDGDPVRPLRDRGRLLDVASQITNALVAAHAAGIVHRDLKPDNILITRDGQVKVLDFGLATGKMGGEAAVLATQAVTAAGTAVGTIAYMSPEQARGESVDARSDLWSLGVLLHELATGERPFVGATAAMVFERILNGVPPPLGDSNPHVPAGWSPMVAKLLEKDPARRYQSAADVRADLIRVAQPGPDSGRTAESSPSIAVLPFANMSGDTEQEYFSDGLAEEIINLLSKTPGLKVTARTSAFAFKGKEQDIRRIAEALGVKTILEGSVRRSGSRLRVTAQLINASDGYHLWSERYDRQLADIFDLQDDISQAITTALEVHLIGAPLPYKPSLPAYEALLRGRYLAQSVEPSQMLRAQEAFDEAIRLDPNYALAYAESALCILYSVFFAGLASTEAHDLIRARAEKALQLDPLLAEGHVALAQAAMLRFDWTESGREFQIGMTRQPVPLYVQWGYALHLFFSRNFAAAIHAIDSLLQRDPLNLLWRAQRALFRLAAEDRDKAVAELNQLIQLAPHAQPPNIFLAWDHIHHGELEQAQSAIDRIVNPRAFPQVSGIRAGLLWRAGRTEEAEQAMQAFSGARADRAARARALYHLVRRDFDAAADAFDTALAGHDLPILVFLYTGLGKELHKHPRWPGLVKRMNLPQVV